MRSRPAWVRADGKRPIQVDGAPASSTDAATWSTFGEVRRSQAGDGFGIMLGSGLGCYDFDHVDDVEAALRVAAIPEPLVFVERSVSGRGVHAFVEAPESWGCRRDGYERYTQARFIRVTGELFDHTLYLPEEPSMPRAVLRAVSDDYRPRPEPIHDVTSAITTGTEQDVLEQVRLRLARTIDDPATSPRDLAAISRRLLEVDKQLRALAAAQALSQEEDEADVAHLPQDQAWAGI